MKFKCLTFFVGILLAISSAGCSKKVIYPTPTALEEKYIASLSDEKQLAYTFVCTERDDRQTFDRVLAKDFHSRDREWGGEKAVFLERRTSDHSFDKMVPIRILQDDSMVALQSRMLGDTLRFRWDILRIEQQEIQEHWSNVNDSMGLNPSGHSEIDGPTIPEQLEETDTNRALVTRFIDQCMIREDGGASKFFNFRLYIQHNRDVGDGLSGLLWAMLKMKLKGHTIKFKHNYHIIAEGNMVLSASEGFVGDEKMAFYDLFRIDENKIVEHWDIISPVDTFLYLPSTNENQ